MRTSRTMLMTTAAAALVLAGCGGDEAGDAVEQLTDAIADENAEKEDDAEPAATDDAAAGGGEDSEDVEVSDDADRAEVVDIAGRAIDVSVHHLGLEYTIAQLTVVDLDAEASADGEVDQRVHGLELTFDASVFNPGSDTATPALPVSMRWDEPGTGNVIDVSGRAEFRQVPGDASSSGEIVVPLAPRDLEQYDDASARLILGHSGSSAAQVPIGAEAELVDRFPVQQPLVGERFDVDDVLVTITAAEVRWDYGNSHVEDGVALLELTYDLEERSGSQSCSTRGQGAFALMLPSGDGIVDEGVTERCVRGDQTETDVRTGFLIDGDYAGEYTLRHERGDDQDEVTFTLIEAAGSPAAERDTR